jgi:hypothetical protein
LHRVTPILKETAERFIAGVTKPDRPVSVPLTINPQPSTQEVVA